jgi:hypothetical protein
MRTSIFRPLKLIVALTGFFSGYARNVDYKNLNQYIVGMHALNAIDAFLHHSATTFKELLNYRLSTFAVQEFEHFNIICFIANTIRTHKAIGPTTFVKDFSTRSFGPKILLPA